MLDVGRIVFGGGGGGPGAGGAPREIAADLREEVAGYGKRKRERLRAHIPVLEVVSCI
jgi:hypothetical protein